MTPVELCPALFAGLVVLGLALLIAVAAGIVVAVRERREQQARIAHRQVALDAESQLRESTQATMRAMRDAIRRYGGQL